MFTPQKLTFAIIFFFVFVAGMIWAYRNDLKTTKIHFKGVYKTLIFIVLFFLVLVFIVKLRHKI